MKNRLISLTMILALFLTMSLPSFASNGTYSIDEIDGGNAFSSVSSQETIVVLTNTNEHIINIAIKNSDSPEIIYQWVITDYPELFNPSSLAFWNRVIEYARSRTDCILSSQAEVTDYAIAGSIRPYSSASADLRSEMRDLHGEEYFRVFQHSSVYNGQTFEIYETKEYRTMYNRQYTWHDTMTIAGIITTIIGGVTTGALVNAICTAFGVVSGLSTWLPANSKMNSYTCRIYFTRATSINGSTYMYNVANEYIDYTGYEDAADNDNRASIDISSQFIEYPQGREYYYSFSSQIADAYIMFERVGQKP